MKKLRIKIGPSTLKIPDEYKDEIVGYPVSNEINLINRKLSDLAIVRIPSYETVNVRIFPTVNLPSRLSRYPLGISNKNALIVGFGFTQKGTESKQIYPSNAQFKYGKFVIDSSYDFLKSTEAIYGENFSMSQSTISDLFSASSNFAQICQGDSGGPVFVKTNDGRMTQVGVTSIVDKYCELKYSVFTDLRPHLHWIRKITMEK